MILKKIITLFIIVLISSFFIIDRVFAQEIAFKSCCVCTTNVSTGGPVPTFNQVVSVSSTITDKKLCDDMSSFFLKRSCVIGPHKECGVTESKVEPTMTKLGEEFGGFKDVILGVTIPGLQLSAPPAEVDEEGNIYISWIGEYLKALYNFSVVMISIIGIVVIILMGIKIITSGGGPAKGEAYKRIGQAVIGLFIAWGSYAILFAINPNLTVFKSLQIMFIPTDPLVVELTTTLADTRDDGTQTTAELESTATSKPAPGSYKEIYTECPVELNGPIEWGKKHAHTYPRTSEFYDKIRSILTEKDTDMAQRVLKIADAATQCKVMLGSCGRTAGTIYALAGAQDDSCLFPKPNEDLKDYKPCWPSGKTIKEYPWNKRGWLNKISCATKDHISDCVDTPKEARELVLKKFKSEYGPTYPESWLDLLQPGDHIVCYNGNTWPNSRGTHSVIFTGWTSKGLAQIIDASIAKQTKHRTLCLKSNCGDRVCAILSIVRPKN